MRPKLDGGHVQDLWFESGSKFWGAAYSDKNFYLRLTVEEMHAFAVFTGKYLRSTAVATPILRLQLTVQVQKPKYKWKSLKRKSL